MYLFERVCYRISGKEIEGYSHAGIASTMKGLLTYKHNSNENASFLFQKDTTTAANNNGFRVRFNYIFGGDGTFSAIIPLEHIFGFCENYQKVMYGVEHELNLRRNHDNDALFKTSVLNDAGNADKVVDGKIDIKKLVWHMPHAKISDEYKLRLYKQIENRITLPLAFLNRQCERYTIPNGTRELDWKLNIASGSEKPRYIIVGFQKEKDNDQKKNPAIFDHLKYTNAYVQLNSERYPEENLNVDFDSNIYAKPYKMLTDYFCNVVGNSNVQIDLISYANLFPLLVFDVSHQSERLKNTPVDIRIRASFAEQVGANSKAYALILSDQFINLESDGNKMNIIY